MGVVSDFTLNLPLTLSAKFVESRERDVAYESQQKLDVVFKKSNGGVMRLPRQIDPNDVDNDLKKRSRITLLQHCDILSGSAHHVATTPAIVT